MVLLFRRLYELRAEEAARGGASVVVVGPPGAGKTTFIKQFLEPRGVEAAEETVGLAPEAEEARGEGLRERAVRLLRGLAERGYVPRDRVERELAGVKGAELLKDFAELPRSFVEHLRERYGGYALYLFHIPPDVEEEREVVKKLLEVAKKVGVEFRWLGLEYVPPGVVAMLRERGEGYVEEQLRLYRRIVEEFGAAGDKLSRLLRLGEGAAKKAGRSLLETLAGPVAELAAALLSLIPGGATASAVLSAAGAVLGVASFFLASEKKWGDWIRLLADWSRLDGRLKDLAAAHIALGLGLDRGRVREVLDGLAAAGGRLKALESEFGRFLDEVKRMALKAMALEHGVAVHFLPDVEGRGLYVNFYVKGRPYLESREPSGPAAVPLVEGGRFGELAAEVLRRLEEEGAVVLVGPRGVGKSTLAAYVVWKALRGGRAYGVVKVAGGVGTEAVLRALAEEAGAELIALYDPSPPEVYYDPDYVKLTKAQQVGEALKELGALAAVERRVKVLAVLPGDLYGAVLEKAEKPASELLKKRLEVDLRDVRFLADVVHEYSKCGGMPAGVAERLAEKIAQFDGGYTLAAKYAGLWLRANGCKVENVERALEAAKRGPKLFFAHYIWHVLLKGRGDLARKAAVPLLLHAYFGPVPVGVTYATKAVNQGVWRFLKPEELEGVGLESLKEDELEPIARWLAQWHEDLVEETLKDLAGLNGEALQKQYKESFRELIEVLNSTRNKVLKEGSKVLDELSFPEEARTSEDFFLTFVNRRLIAVFKGEETRSCWRRVAFIAGHSLVRYTKLPQRDKLPEDFAEVLSVAVEPCAVDAYLTTNGMLSPLSIAVVMFPYFIEVSYARHIPQIRRIRSTLSVLSSFVDYEAINTAKEIAEELVKWWRNKGGFILAELFYALGLAALIAETDIDENTADLLLYVAPFAIRRVIHPTVIPMILMALRPLGEKAPHRYVAVLAAATERETLDGVAVQYIYDTVQQLWFHLLETDRRSSLVFAVEIYSDLLTTQSVHTWKFSENILADMCLLYDGLRRKSRLLEREASEYDLLTAIAGMYVLDVALERSDLTQLVQEYCDLSDLTEEINAVKTVLEDATDAEKLKRIMKDDADFKQWIEMRSVAEDAEKVVMGFRSQFMFKLARYSLRHAVDEKGKIDTGKLREIAKEFEEKAEIIKRRLNDWRIYLVARGFALRASFLAAESWEEFLATANGFHLLWEEAEKYALLPQYLEEVARALAEYLVYLAASGEMKQIDKLLKERRWLLDYAPRVAVVTRLMLRLFGVRERVELKEIIEGLAQSFEEEFLPALRMWANLTDRDGALNACVNSVDTELCIDAVMAVTGNKYAAERLKQEFPLLKLSRELNGKTYVEVISPANSLAQLALMLLATIEGRTEAVRLHGLWASVSYYNEPLLRLLFHSVYGNCTDLNSEGCKLALLKLYYLHF
ncbi:MAG: hypothetical protein RXO32_09915 [Thermoproteus sp.]